MHVRTISQTGVGQSSLINTIPNDVFNVGLGVVVSGSATYTIEHTFDGVNFFAHDCLVSQATNQDGNYAFPVASIRINITSGVGTVTLTAIQAKG